MRRVILTFFFCCINSKLFQEVFVDTPDQVFLLAERLMVDLVDFINKLLDIVGSKVTGSKCTLNETTLYPFVVGSNAVQRSIKSNIQFRRGSIDDSRPPSFLRQIISSART